MTQIRINNSGNTGKLPPQCCDIEEIVLGAILMESQAIHKVINLLKPEMFYMDKHQTIYNACYELFKNNNPIDIKTVTAKLRNFGELERVGGAYAITELTNNVASAANIEYHCMIIIQKYMQREVIRISSQAIQLAYEDTTDVLTLLDEFQLELFKINERREIKKAISMRDLMLERLQEYRVKQTNDITGFPTGLKDIDKATNGINRGDLVIIAARPSMGKTIFAISIGKNIAKQGKKVSVNELEMKDKQVVDRVFAGDTGIYMEDLIKHRLSETEFLELEKTIENSFTNFLFIDDSSDLSIIDIRSKAIEFRNKHGLDLLIVDYIQLMKKSDRKGITVEQAVGEISRGLKSLAKELDIPVIALSQLSRAVETRPGNDRTPRLSDLRDSGSLEQDADVIIFLLRPEYYGINEMEGIGSTSGLCLAIIAKNRQGSPGDVIKLKFNGALMRFDDWETNETEQIEVNF